MEKHGFYLAIKYTLDRIFALIAVILLCPLFLLISVLILLDSRGPVMFRQQREGRNREIIRIYKFRTMITKDIKFDKNNAVIDENNVNVTKVGKVLRKFKLDEIPQLLNIIRGEMSFVGPRPLLSVYSDSYEKWEFNKFKTKPGLSGLAQINGNGYLTPQARSYYDIVYNEHVSLCLDTKIFFKTFLTVFKGEKRYLKEPTEEQIAEMRDKYND